MRLTLSQLSMIHSIGAKQSWSNQRLVPTTICSVLTLIHFHVVLWFSPSLYPLLNYVSCIFETLLVLVILVAFSLNILTQLLLEGSITRPFIGHAASLMPRWDEDFSIVLLRLGVASFEATSVAGLGNEVSGVSLTEHSEAATYHVQYGEVEMNYSGVSSITHTIENQEGRRTRKEGFANEIRRVKVSSSQGDPVVDMTWFTEFKRLGCAISRFGIGCCRMVGRILRGQPAFLRTPVASGEQAQNLGSQSLTASREGEAGTSSPDQRDIYERFLSGEVLSDDEEDFCPSSSSVPRYDDDDDDDQDTRSDTPDEDVDTQALLGEISATTTSYAPAPLLLAHMIDTSPSPLTRRRYRSLVPREDAAYYEQRELEASLFAKGGHASRRDSSTNDSRRNCVICTDRERQIIFWPCRWVPALYCPQRIGLSHHTIFVCQMSSTVRRLSTESCIPHRCIEAHMSMLPSAVSSWKPGSGMFRN